MLPQRASVRPRVVLPGSGESLPLVEEFRAYVNRGDSGIIGVIGGPGSGKTTAIQYLRAAFSEEVDLTDLDSAAPADVEVFGRSIVVYAASDVHGDDHLAVYRLAPWNSDDLVEYLLNKHQPRCGSVMARIKAEDGARLQGNAELWSIVLDELASDDGVPDVEMAIMRYLERFLDASAIETHVGHTCLERIAARLAPAWPPGDVAFEVQRILRHAFPQTLMATCHAAAALRRGAGRDFLDNLRLCPEVIQAVARLVRDDATVRAHLTGLLDGPAWNHATSVSLLHTFGGWTPTPGWQVRELAGALLAGVSWPEVQLDGANLTAADLTGAVLCKADLSNANLSDACLVGALLDAATLVAARAANADLSNASLRRVSAARSRFDHARMDGAILDEARLEKTSFVDAELGGASFRGASLTLADLRGVRVKDADFTAADLSRANLTGVSLCDGCFANASFVATNLEGADLEFLKLPGVKFDCANLSAALLTGSTMPGASFESAKLTGARLAEVEWEGVCLRNADLRGATFHLGSTRSVLVGSPIASEGSRTGFYTDEYEEQHYRSPEEIRKANLRGADLRGASIRDVDFYLVDLRGARYDNAQARHFRSCRAILKPP